MPAARPIPSTPTWFNTFRRGLTICFARRNSETIPRRSPSFSSSSPAATSFSSTRSNLNTMGTAQMAGPSIPPRPNTASVQKTSDRTRARTDIPLPFRTKSMSDSATIPNAPPLNPALDYAFLRQEGVSLLQHLSSSIWTDYNEHDPGVTTLEQLCYALTELAYRAELPVAQLLADPADATIRPHRHGLFLPRRILPCSPVTIDDYRKLIVDRVPGVANVWFAPLSSHNGNAVSGLYD